MVHHPMNEDAHLEAAYEERYEDDQHSDEYLDADDCDEDGCYCGKGKDCEWLLAADALDEKEGRL